MGTRSRTPKVRASKEGGPAGRWSGLLLRLRRREKNRSKFSETGSDTFANPAGRAKDQKTVATLSSYITLFAHTDTMVVRQRSLLQRVSLNSKIRRRLEHRLPSETSSKIAMLSLHLDWRVFTGSEEATHKNNMHAQKRTRNQIQNLQVSLTAL